MPRPTPTPTRKLGSITLTALVVGNIVGSGIFLLPASLAPFGAVSMIGWVVTAAGSMLLGLVMARLAHRAAAPGGPYGYTRSAFGELPGFLVGWGYWISCWCAQAAIAVAMVGYLGKLVPSLASNPALAATVAIGTILLLACVNVAGIREAGAVQIVTTAIKLVPLVAIAGFGLGRFDASLLSPLNPSGESLAGATQSCLALTLWAFLGFESAAIAGTQADDARRTVPRATLLGIAITTVLYMTSTVAVLGLVPREELASSTAPFADAARTLWGPWAETLVAGGAFVSCFGALNGWILVTGQMAHAIAHDGLFPGFFAQTSRRDTPAAALVVSSALACILVVAFYSESLVAMFNAMILLSTLASLVPLVFCTMADVLLAAKARRDGGSEPMRRVVVIATLAFGYGLLAIAGAGHETVSWGFLLLLAGIPFYVLARARTTPG